MPEFEPSAAAPTCREVPVLSLERRASPEFGESDLFTLTFAFPGWKSWHPGQFVMIRPHAFSRPDVLWARPFSISQADEREVSIVFQAAGRATREMPALRRGDILTVWGPLGNAFAVSPSVPTLLLAGGVGIAPFVGYIKRHPAPQNLRLEFGHRLPLECYPFADCLEPQCFPDGPAGGLFLGARNHRECCPDDLARFIATLEESIRETAARQGLVLACGPLPFLRSVQTFALRHGVRAQLSLETRMACGVGACLGCVVKNNEMTREGVPKSPEAFSYVQTCTKGPVFWADAVELEGA